MATMNRLYRLTQSFHRVLVEVIETGKARSHLRRQCNVKLLLFHAYHSPLLTTFSPECLLCHNPFRNQVSICQSMGGFSEGPMGRDFPPPPFFSLIFVSKSVTNSLSRGIVQSRLCCGYGTRLLSCQNVIGPSPLPFRIF